MIRKSKQWAALAMAFILACNAYAQSAPPPVNPAGTTSEQRSQARQTCIAQYTAVGAIGGALLGALLGRRDRGTGAVIGAAAGGALAFAIAWGRCLQHYSDLTSYTVANAEQTSQQVGYSAERGAEIKIQSFSIVPDSLAPGSEVTLNGSYYVMAPEGQTDIKVTETRVVHYFDSGQNAWKELGSVDSQVTSALGTRRAEGHFDLPKDVPEGRYRITLKVAALDKQDQATREIVVRKA